MKKTKLRKKAKAKSEGWWKNHADDLMQDVHKTMHKNCLVCGGKNEVGHHHITKSLSSFLRYNFQNLIPVCHSCHFKHHISSDPNISSVIQSKMGPEWVQWIESVRRNPIKMGILYYKCKVEEFNLILEGSTIL